MSKTQAPEGARKALAVLDEIGTWDSKGDTLKDAVEYAYGSGMWDILRAALAAQPHPAGYKAALAARSATAIACLPDAPYKASLQRLHDDMLAAIADQPATFDVERLIRECLPGGHSCDPQAVADAIREWVRTAQPKAAPVALTPSQVHDLCNECHLDWHRGWSIDEEPNRYLQLARAIEAAHGIPAPQTKEPTNDR